MTYTDIYGKIYLETENKIQNGKGEMIMEIKVTNIITFETLFIGEPEDWLAENNYDDVIEDALNRLEHRQYGESVTYTNDNNETILIEKDIYFE